MTTKKTDAPREPAYGRAAVAEDVYEVLVTSRIGHQSVQRVVANSAAEARKFVEDNMPGAGDVTEVLSPADQRAREREVQRDVAARQAEARAVTSERT